MVLYGLSTTIGAGIYALVGELTGMAGYFAPISFLTASFIATLTGLLVILAGLVSAAALINGFVGYLHQFIILDRLPIIVITALGFGSIAAWRISSSVSLAAFITVIEIGGLLLIIGVSFMGIELHLDSLAKLLPSAETTHWQAIFAGALLAFYAFIGFEDMVDVAEEVKNVKRNLPMAILLTLVITTLLYMLIMVSAVLAVSPGQLASTEAPLAFLYQHFTDNDATLISIIGLLAIINGALIQIIMASRVMYRLSSRNQLPAIFSLIHPKNTVGGRNNISYHAVYFFNDKLGLSTY